MYYIAIRTYGCYITAISSQYLNYNCACISGKCDTMHHGLQCEDDRHGTYVTGQLGCSNAVGITNGVSGDSKKSPYQILEGLEQKTNLHMLITGV